MTSFEFCLYLLLILVAVLGAAVVFIRDPRRQILPMGLFGIVQTVLYFALQTPDVALSQLTATTLAIPAFALLTLARLEVKPK